jgi:uncharacterized membrane protein YgcG
METLLDLSTLFIEEVIDRLKAVDDRDEAQPTNSVTSDGKLLFTKEHWLARLKEMKKQEGLSSSRDRHRQPHKKSSDGGGGGEKGGGGGGKECKATRDDIYLNCGHHGHWARDDR